MIQYSSNEGDLVCDLFLGSFSTAKVAIGLNRRACGFEKSPTAFEYQVSKVCKIQPGGLLSGLRQPDHHPLANQRKPWTRADKDALWERYGHLRKAHRTQKKIIEVLSEELGRGRFSLLKMLAQLQEEHARRRGQDDSPGDLQ